MSEYILGITCTILGLVFIIQQIQIARVRRLVFKLDGLLLHTMEQQDALIKMIEAVPGNPKIKRAVRIRGWGDEHIN